MRWFRTNIRYGAWCAIFALAIQFTLSFGHMHGLASGSAGGAVALAELSELGTPAAVPDNPGIPQKAPLPGFDFCAICAVTNLAAGALAAVGISLTTYGLLKWRSRQAIRDKGEELDVQKKDKELQNMSRAEVEEKARDEAESDDRSPFVGPSVGPPLGLDRSAGARSEDGGPHRG